jgi:hypothetical protein
VRLLLVGSAGAWLAAGARSGPDNRGGHVVSHAIRTAACDSEHVRLRVCSASRAEAGDQSACGDVTLVGSAARAEADDRLEVG